MKPEVKPSYLAYFLIIVYLNVGVSGQESPCPDIYEYKFDGYEWHGVITIPSVGRGRTNIVVTLSVEDTISQDNAGELLLLNDINTLYATIDNGGLLQYKNIFPISDHVPTIRSIKLNKREYCSNPAGPSTGVQSTITVIHSFQTDTNTNKPGVQVIPQSSPPPPPPQPVPLQPKPLPQPKPVPSLSSNFETHVRPSDSQNNNDASWLASLPINNACGTRTKPGTGSLRPIHTIINGWAVEPGEYPWLVALYDLKMQFICGGSLVTSKKAITAAHCINVDWLYVELGRYDREDKSEEYIVRIARDIKIHHDYKPNTGHADIAILTFTEEVKFNDKIKPICIWPFGPGGTGMNGAVVGWGTDLSGDPTPKIMQTAVDIVSQEKCLQANENYINITSKKTYCAGGKGTGPCKGDSGGGMYINVRNRWYLKGIISTSLGPNDYSCNVNLFAVYSDISSFLDWLKTYLV